VFDETMNYSNLEEAYGTPFGQRVPVGQARKDDQPIEKPMSLEEKSAANLEKNKGLLDSIQDSLPLDKTPATENFRVEQKPHPMHRAREHFIASQPASVLADSGAGMGDDKISRILRLVEQNRTGYERPATQDMLMYIFTGVVFLFTFDTFVTLGKGMRRY
jgi:hypothetical protein